MTPGGRPKGRQERAPTASWSLSQWALLMGVALIACFAAMLILLPNDADCPVSAREYPAYNDSRTLSASWRLSDGRTAWRIAVVTDLDHDSKSADEKNTWLSLMRHGTLLLAEDRRSAEVRWDADTLTLKSTLAQGGRAMELSDLCVFDGKLLTVDDRTGVLYRIVDGAALPWLLLTDGAGNVSKGFKGEWLAVKDRQLYVGGLGKEWTTTEGEFRNTNPMWIKLVDHTGAVRHVDWVDVYKRLRAAADIVYPGYMIHESAQWSDVHQRWFFLPRRASKEMYTEAADERRGTNILLTASADFSDISIARVGDLLPSRGFSAFQFVPGTRDSLIIALKSEEDKGVIASYLTLFHVDGTVIIPDTQLNGSYKFEGIEFV